MKFQVNTVTRCMQLRMASTSVEFSCLLLVLTCLQSLDYAVGARPPNFIIVFADDFGFDVECFGSPTTRTVHINQMAAEVGSFQYKWQHAKFDAVASPVKIHFGMSARKVPKGRI